MNEDQEATEEEEVKEAFLQKPDQCPFCEHPAYFTKTESTENEEIIEECTCIICERVWYTVFTLSDCLLSLDQD